MRTLLLAAVFTAISLHASAQQTQQRIERGALRVENVPETPAAMTERLNRYVNVRAASFQDWTPEGGVLISTRLGETDQIHRIAMPMGAREQLTFYAEPVTSAHMRPNAHTVLFSRDVGGDESYAGYLLDPVTGAAASFTAPGTRNTNFVMRGDGGLVAWAQEPNTSPNYDIYVADPGDPSSRRRVLQGEGAVAPIDFSPDGTKLLIGRYLSAAESQRFILDLASGELLRLTPDLRVSYSGGEFTADGDGVVVASDEGAQFQGLVQIDLATGARERLTPAHDWGVEEFDVSDDGRFLAYTLNEAGVSTLHLMDLRTRRALAAPADLPAGVISGIAFDHRGRNLGFTLSSSAIPGDVFSWDLRGRRLTRWTQSETSGLPPASFVTPRLISWRSFDGREISGFLYEPRTPGPHPVVIYIHGGPESQFRPSFFAQFQYWVNELGIAVIAPNVRGSAGYGRDFLALDNAERREDSVRDIGALLDWIAAEPSIDARRVAVYGRSYGGYMSLAVMTHYNDRLAGGVDIVGISNWITFLENTSGYRRDLRRAEYGDERDPAMRAILERMSPLTSIGNISRPMFVVAGYNDPRVPYTEGEQVAAAIRRNGGEVWFLMAMNEGHVWLKRENLEAVRGAEALFLRRVLGLE